MLAFPGMLIQAARAANMRCPADSKDIEVDERLKAFFTHFWVFCKLQLERRMTSPTEHFDNAKIIAAIPYPRLAKMTTDEFRAAGVIGI